MNTNPKFDELFTLAQEIGDTEFTSTVWEGCRFRLAGWRSRREVEGLCAQVQVSRDNGSTWLSMSTLRPDADVVLFLKCARLLK